MTTFQVNGKWHELEVPADATLADVLRSLGLYGVRVARFDRIVLRRTATIANDVVLSAVALWPPDDAEPFLTPGTTQYLDLTVLRWAADNSPSHNAYALQYEQVLVEALRIKR